MKGTWILALIAAVMLPACGGDSGGGEGSGSGSSSGGGIAAIVSSDADLVGTWVVDTEGLKPTMLKAAKEEAMKNLEGMDPEARKMAEAMMTDEMIEAGLKMAMTMFETMSIEMKADGTYTAKMGPGEADTGKYKLDGSTLTITPDDPDDDGPKNAEFRDGKIFVKAEGQPFELVLIKK